MYKQTDHIYNSNAGINLFKRNNWVSRRKQKKVMSKKARIDSRRKFFTVRAAKDWNNMPEKVASGPSLNIFERILDRH